MRLLVVWLALAASARADVAVQGRALLSKDGFSDGSGHSSEVAVSGRWIAVIDAWDSCCIDSTLVLHVVTDRGKSVIEIPFACESEGCETKLERARAERFLARHHFVVPRDAISLPSDENDHSNFPPFEVDGHTLTIEERASFAVYLRSKKLLIYRWFNPNIPDGDSGSGEYWGVVVRTIK